MFVTSNLRGVVTPRPMSAKLQGAPLPVRLAIARALSRAPIGAARRAEIARRHREHHLNVHSDNAMRVVACEPRPASLR